MIFQCQNLKCEKLGKKHFFLQLGSLKYLQYGISNVLIHLILFMPINPDSNLASLIFEFIVMSGTTYTFWWEHTPPEEKIKK